MEDGVIVAIVIAGVLQLVTWIVFLVMASNVSHIKRHIEAMSVKQNAPTQETPEERPKCLPLDLLVVELKTGKQMRLGQKRENGKYECYSNNYLYVGDFAESEFMEFDKWVKEVYKK